VGNPHIPAATHILERNGHHRQVDKLRLLLDCWRREVVQPLPLELLVVHALPEEAAASDTDTSPVQHAADLMLPT
jgi:hypothetical protein